MMNSSRQKYLEEMKAINAAKAKKAQDESPDLDLSELLDDDSDQSDEINNVEREIDNVDHDSEAVTEVTMTQDEFFKQKSDIEAKKVFEQIKGLSLNKLSDHDKFKIQSYMDAFSKNEIQDPVIKFLITEKIKISNSYQSVINEMHDLQHTLITKISELSTRITKAKGILENIDNQLLGMDSPLTSPEG